MLVQVNAAFRVPCPTEQELAAEWDSLAPLRHRQIVSGIDLTYARVLTPAMEGLIAQDGDVMDVGCGTGEFTARLAASARSVTGIDPSDVSIKLAQSEYGHISSLRFESASVENYQAPDVLGRFDVVVAHMVIMDVLRLDHFMRSARRLVKAGGSFVFSCTHPWFWPAYWGYERQPWFRYGEEHCVRARFAVSKESTALYATHIHRPLSQYVKTFLAAGFDLEVLLEPLPTAEVESLYPTPWKYPRYLVGRLRAAR